MSNLSRRQLLRLGAAGLATSLLAPGWASAVSAKSTIPRRKYNVLFIAADDLRPQLGCYGHKEMVTPNIDRLAKNGVLFERHYVQIAICIPSRVAMMTGVRPDTTRQLFYEHVFRQNCPGITTMPELFQKHGYYTVTHGKIWHNYETAGFSEPPSNPPWKGWYQSEELRDAEPYAKPYPPTECADMPEEGYMDAKLGRMAIDTLQRLAKMDQPFWFGVGFFKPHLPFVAPKKYWDLYKREELPLPPNRRFPLNMPDYANNNWGDMRSFSDIPQYDFVMSDDKTRELIHGYDACVSLVDAQVGRVLAELDRLGLRDNTIVVLWGDHGWHLGEQNMWGKFSEFEAALDAPLIISVPRMKNAGKRTRALTETVDIFPTLADLCGLPIPEIMEGTSMAPLLDRPDRKWKKAAFSQKNYTWAAKDTPPDEIVMGYSMRTDRYRYTEWVQGWQGWKKKVLARELYDFKKDPLETVNIVDQSEFHELVTKLAEQLHTGWRAALPTR